MILCFQITKVFFTFPIDLVTFYRLVADKIEIYYYINCAYSITLKNENLHSLQK
jgi:hypothetical protein